MKKDSLVRLLIISCGIFIAAFGLNAFLIPNNIAAGGFSGVAILIGSLVPIKVGTLILLMNIPLFILSFKVLGKSFVIVSLFGTVLYSLAIDIMSFVPAFTNDLVLCSIYGGMCVGAGYGLILKYKGTTGGTDMLAMLINKKNSGFPVGSLMFILDLSVIICSVILIGLDRGMYATISVFVSTKTIDLIIQGTGRAKSFFIITDKGNVIADEIMKKLERGVTFLQGKGAYTGHNKDILICAVRHRSEITVLKELIYNLDKDAFVLIGDMTEIMGEGF